MLSYLQPTLEAIGLVMVVVDAEGTFNMMYASQ